MSAKPQLPRRKIPSLDALLRSEPGRRATETFGRALLKRTLTQTLDSVRAAAERGIDPPEHDVIMARAVGLASRAATGLNPVINATGVVLHTGLGRAPLPDRVLEVTQYDRELFYRKFPPELRATAERLPFAAVKPPFEARTRAGTALDRWRTFAWTRSTGT